MEKANRYIALLVIIFIAACQSAPGGESTLTAVSPTISIPTTAPPATTEATTAATDRPPATAVSSPSSESMPPITFNWDDPEIYRAGLVASAQDSLALLPTATIYSMTLTIDPANARVGGQQTIRYTNNHAETLSEIYLHLFPNLLGGAIEISDLRVDGTVVDWLYEQSDNSVLYIPLHGSLAPGAQSIITLDFETAVPQDSGRNYGVFALVDDVMTLAHFYPMVAVYDDQGWHITPPVEFGDPTFAEASFYLVNLTAPSDQIIAGSGVTLEQTNNGRVQTQSIVAGPARDFYLALSPHYIAETLTIGDTTIHSYAPAEFRAGAQQAAEVAANALDSFNARLGAYPYTELDIVATPTLALGVEYPGIIAITQREYDPDDPISGNIPNSVYLETTVAHEMGHQWFYNVVGNDQLEEPWLDEALAQYVTGLYYLDNYGRDAAQSYETSWRDRWDRVNDEEIPIGLPVGAYEGAAYSAIVYGRGPLFVQTLAAQMGQTEFDEFLKDYVSQNQWRIATTESFRTLAEAHCQCDLSSLFDEWVYPR